MSESFIRWQSPSLLKNITGYGEYIVEVDEGVDASGRMMTRIVHVIHLDSIGAFWDISADYYDDSCQGFVDKSDVLRFVKFDPYSSIEKE